MKLRTMHARGTLALLAGFLIVTPLAAVSAAGQDSAAGATVYKSKCATCHGPDGGGTPMGKTLKVADLRSAEVQSKSDAELIQVVSEGKGNMPGFKGTITDDEINAVVTFVRTFAKSDSKKK